VSTQTEPPPTEPREDEKAPPEPVARLGIFLLRVLGAVAIPVIAFGGLWAAFDLLRDESASRILVVGVALVLGVFGIFFLYWGMNRLVDMLPERYSESVRPYVFVGPCLVILGVYLVYPVLNTLWLSFLDASSDSFVGVDNYRFVFTDADMLRSIRNTFGWVIIVPIFGTSIGLLFAVLVDRLSRRKEAIAKSLIFMPMAISFAGASVTWRLIYSYRPTGFGSNIGLLNGIRIAAGQDPIAWLQIQPWNNLMLMVIMIWMQTGFAMVVLSAAIKAIPDELIEAARIDGASEVQVFWRIMLPTILPTVVVVVTYMVINALKVFDIVFMMGNPEADGTVVIAERMITWFFTRLDAGKGAAIACVLFAVILPVMIWNVRRFREQEAMR
jgi:alpha-glucoside transport system permease protein